MRLNDAREQAHFVVSKTGFGWPGELSYGLLEGLGGKEGRDTKTFEYVMRGLRLSCGDYRTTYRSRFLSLNPVANREIGGRLERSDWLHVRDWGW